MHLNPKVEYIVNVSILLFVVTRYRDIIKIEIEKKSMHFVELWKHAGIYKNQNKCMG